MHLGFAGILLVAEKGDVICKKKSTMMSFILQEPFFRERLLSTLPVELL